MESESKLNQHCSVIENEDLRNSLSVEKAGKLVACYRGLQAKAQSKEEDDEW
jgi:hypothetical protein